MLPHKWAKQTALGLLLALAATGGLSSSAVAADATKKEAPPAGKLSKDVQKVLAEVQKLQKAGDNAGAAAKLAEADAVPNRGKYDDFVIGQFRYNIAIANKDNAALEAGLKAMLDSGFVAQEDQVKIVRNLVALAFQRKDIAAATAETQRWIQLAPNDPDPVLNLGKIYYNEDKYAEALSAFKSAAALAEKSGQKVDENTYKIIAQTALKSGKPAEIAASMRNLVLQYPNPTNWRDALVIFRDQQGVTDPMILDSYRLQWRNNALNGERDYIEMAEIALKRGLPNEAKLALEKGQALSIYSKGKSVAMEMLTQARSRLGADQKSLPGLEKEARAAKTGDLAANGPAQGYLSYGDYPKAVEYYQLALQKGVKNPDDIYMQLGIALAGAGKGSEAQEAFSKVKGSLAKSLADLWAAYASTTKPQ